MNETFQRYARSHHEAVRQWKADTGRKVIGYLCCVVPEEIIYAAGALPVRIVGTSDELERAQLHVPPNTCPFMRSCLDAGLRGLYDYLDGVVIPTTCDVVSAMDYFWDEYVTHPQPAQPREGPGHAALCPPHQLPGEDHRACALSASTRLSSASSSRSWSAPSIIPSPTTTSPGRSRSTTTTSSR